MRENISLCCTIILTINNSKCIVCFLFLAWPWNCAFSFTSFHRQSHRWRPLTFTSVEAALVLHRPRVWTARADLFVFAWSCSSLPPSLRLHDTSTRWWHVGPRALSGTLQVTDLGVGVRLKSSTYHMRFWSPCQRHLHSYLLLQLPASHTWGGRERGAGGDIL